jgi:hypothetical protein
MISGVWPPLNPAGTFPCCFWPLWPRPDVFPFPEAGPRPLLILLLYAPGVSESDAKMWAFRLCCCSWGSRMDNGDAAVWMLDPRRGRASTGSRGGIVILVMWCASSSWSLSRCPAAGVSFGMRSFDARNGTTCSGLLRTPDRVLALDCQLHVSCSFKDLLFLAFNHSDIRYYGDPKEWWCLTNATQIVWWDNIYE